MCDHRPRARICCMYVACAAGYSTLCCMYVVCMLYVLQVTAHYVVCMLYVCCMCFRLQHIMWYVLQVTTHYVVCMYVVCAAGYSTLCCIYVACAAGYSTLGGMCCRLQHIMLYVCCMCCRLHTDSDKQIGHIVYSIDTSFERSTNMTPYKVSCINNFIIYFKVLDTTFCYLRHYIS